jgi:coenzyme F420-dependent glucose-6-phosphate dehydrogenase
VIEMKVSFDTDAQRALEDTRHWAALALSGEEKMAVEDPLEMERLAGALSAEDAAQRFLVSDDPDEHVAQIAPYIELGFNHLVFHAPGNDQRRFFELYSRHILPRLRHRFG